MARSGADLALAFDLVVDVQQPRSAIESPRGLRILLLTSHPLATVDPAIVAAIEAAAGALEAARASGARGTHFLPRLAPQQQEYLRILPLATARRGAPT